MLALNLTCMHAKLVTHWKHFKHYEIKNIYHTGWGGYSVSYFTTAFLYIYVHFIYIKLKTLDVLYPAKSRVSCLDCISFCIIEIIWL